MWTRSFLIGSIICNKSVYYAIYLKIFCGQAALELVQEVVEGVEFIVKHHFFVF